jgi:hypothetical protein
VYTLLPYFSFSTVFILFPHSLCYSVYTILPYSSFSIIFFTLLLHLR